MAQQFHSTRKRSQMRQIALLEQLTATPIDLRSWLTILLDTRQLWQNLIASHANQRTNLIKRHIVTIFSHSLLPGTGMRIITVHKCTVYIKDYATNLCHYGTLPFQISYSSASLLSTTLV